MPANFYFLCRKNPTKVPTIECEKFQPINQHKIIKTKAAGVREMTANTIAVRMYYDCNIFEFVGGRRYTVNNNKITFVLDHVIIQRNDDEAKTLINELGRGKVVVEITRGDKFKMEFNSSDTYKKIERRNYSCRIYRRKINNKQLLKFDNVNH
jgi:hypothetical protein